MRWFKYKGTLFQQVALAFVGLTIVPLLLLGWMQYRISSDAIMNNNAIMLQNITEQSKDHLATLLAEVDQAHLNLIDSDDITSLMLKPPANPGEEGIVANTIMQRLSSVRTIGDIQRVSWYPLETEAYPLYNQLVPIAGYSGQAWYQRIKQAEEERQWVLEEHREGYGTGTTWMITQYRMLKYKRSLQRLGIAGVSIPIRQLREHLLLPKQLNDQRLLLLMEDGTILADTQALEEGKRLNPLYLGSEHGEGSSYWVQPSRDERLFVTRTRLQQPGWTIMSLVPERTLMGSMNIVRNALIGLLVLYLGLGGWIGFYLFTKLTRPITDLAAWMKQVDTGNLEVRSIPYNGQGEIPFLFRSFQMMVVRLKEQIEQIYASEREKKELEFEALNFQIRPHFLYNTLDAIKWKAKRGQEDEVVQMIESLSVVLRRTLTDMSFVTLRQEVDLVKHYVELEQHRHKNAFSILYDIDEQLLDQEVPRLLIQPLVENAIRHGALKSDEHGLILMRIYRRRSVVVEVQDNGPGFPEQFRPQRELPREHNELGGIGLANVHKRLELYYGTDSHMEWGKTEHGYTFIRLLLD